MSVTIMWKCNPTTQNEKSESCYVLQLQQSERGAMENMKIYTYTMHRAVHPFWTKLITQTSSFSPSYRSFKQWNVYLYIHDDTS